MFRIKTPPLDHKNIYKQIHKSTYRKMTTPKNSQGYRIADPRGSLCEDQRVRPSPIMHRLSSTRRATIEKFAEDYSGFLDSVRIAPDVVSQVSQMQGMYGRGDKTQMITNPEGSAFALIKYGTRPSSEGTTILFGHNDSPCLRVKPNPLQLEWDPDKLTLHSGVMLGVIGYGGIMTHQWAGHHFDMVGWASIDGRKKKIGPVNMYCADICQHTDLRLEEDDSMAEAHTVENLALTTGFPDRKSLLKSLGLKGLEDFPRSRLYVVPRDKTQKVGPYYLAGYGHDPRVGLYPAVRALLDSSPKYTSVVIGFDNEEVGSMGSGGANGMFFDHIMNFILTQGGKKPLNNLTEAVKLQTLSNSLAINTDVDVSASSLEEEDRRVDWRNIAKHGHGPFVSAVDNVCDGDQISPLLVDETMGLLRKEDVPFQLTGSALVADSNEGFATMSGFLAERGIPTINIGVPTGSTHSIIENVHMGDLEGAHRAYKAILKRPVSQRRAIKVMPPKGAARKATPRKRRR
jgi:aspartyl aminopeptidase